MASKRLDSICSMIQAVSGLSEPFDYNFDGPVDDVNLFAQIVRGQQQQWRIWEDSEHVAFLTPFPNTPGFTVLVPRAHCSSDIFSLEGTTYSKSMVAARKVAAILKTAFGTSQCGMIFEGLEIEYTHVKLIPIHKPVGAYQRSPKVAPFHTVYQGNVSSLDGPIAQNSEHLARESQDLRQMISTQSTLPSIS